jgi:hypothetical protein
VNIFKELFLSASIVEEDGTVISLSHTHTYTQIHIHTVNIFKELLLSTSIVEEDGTVISYQDVVKNLQKDTVSTGCGLGFSGGSSK